MWRGHLFVWLLVAGVAGASWAQDRPTEPFDREILLARAAELAKQPHSLPPPPEGEGRARIPSINRIRVDPETLLEVGELGGMRCVAVGVGAEIPAPRGCAWMPLRASFRVLSADEFRMAGRASEIVEWERAHRFCGRCGGRTEACGEPLARRCTECGSLHFPRLSPAVLVSVTRGGRILLARSAHFPPGMFSTLAISAA